MLFAFAEGRRREQIFFLKALGQSIGSIFGRALQRPFGLAHVINRHFKTSGCGAIYRSRMSQLSVPHPTQLAFFFYPSTLLFQLQVPTFRKRQIRSFGYILRI